MIKCVVLNTYTKKNKKWNKLIIQLNAVYKRHAKNISTQKGWKQKQHFADINKKEAGVIMLIRDGVDNSNITRGKKGSA